MDSLQLKIKNFARACTIPEVLATLLAELENEKSTSSSVAKILNQDISLSARLLRAANSPLYRRQFDIVTVEMAISVLGMKAVRALALSVSLFDITRKSKLNDHFNLKDFWRHNLEVAILSQKIADKCKHTQPEEAFVCGLMHDLGAFFFIQEYPSEYADVLKLKNAGEPIESAEQKVCKITHSEVGAAIASIWRLPSVISESILNHHQDELPEISPDKIKIWHIVNLAHRFCRKGFDIGSEPTPDEISKRYQIANMFGIEKETMRSLIKDVPEIVIQTASFLDIDIGDPLMLLQNANNELGKLYELYEMLMIKNENLQSKLIKEEKNKSAIEALQTTLATMSHYVNNANTAIIGRAQILDLYMTQGRLQDPEGKIAESVKIISDSVDVISAVLDELKEFPEYKTVVYHDNSRILDIDKNLKARLGRLARS
ncbi:MAG: HDOD domain-containing protein [candidate division Zixibacteria bacterium]|nr:HDOD domain-containing protein [candidate division Zixibacteria bacterium]